eukprot:1554989-Amphidinium_carterae.2
MQLLAFPLGTSKVIHQLVVTKTNVCVHAKQGWVLAQVDHLGIFSLMIQQPSIYRMAAQIGDIAWVQSIVNMALISVCDAKQCLEEMYLQRDVILSEFSCFF